MNRSLINALCGIGLTAAITACSSENVNVHLGAGRITPRLTIDPDVVVAEDVNHMIAIDTVPEISDFKLTLYDDNSGQSYTWESSSDFPPNNLYRTGQYTLSAYWGDILSEGFNSPFFYGETRFNVTESGEAVVDIKCTLYNTMIDASMTPEVTGYFKEFALLIHPENGGYIRYSSDETRPIFMRPGNVSLSVHALTYDGHETDFHAADISDALSGHYYHVTVDLIDNDSSVPSLLFSFSEKIETDDVLVPLTEALLEGSGPIVEHSGFVPGETIHVPEGSKPDEPLTITVRSSSLEAVTATFQSMEMIAAGLPSEVNLLKLTPEENNLLQSYGLRYETTDSSMTIDFTDVVPYIRRRADNSEVTFAVTATDRSGRMSSPISFSVIPDNVPINIIEITPITAGVDKAQIVLSSSGTIITSNISIETLDADGRWSVVGSVQFSTDEKGRCTATFDVGSGSTDDVNVRILYCQSTCAEITIPRVSPRYDIAVDAYALKADIKIIPFEAEMLNYIVENALVYVNGTPATILNRNQEEGIITISGLEASSSYEISLSVMRHPEVSDFSPIVHATTERAASLRNGDFEDTGDGPKYKDMPCGGRFSQSYVEIYNRQNLFSFDMMVPKDWANTNSKTFNKRASNHNTWYMQPSCCTVTDASSGAYAVKLSTVGWDPDGETIPDYLQQSQPFVDYSRTIPKIKYKAVGKLFLGRYDFDISNLTETYTEGISVSSRPSALNGFYKYVPGEDMPGDRGLALIEVFGIIDGKETVIAGAKTLLDPATSYTAFSVPLQYSHFGVKATRINIMMASSYNIGTIEYETRTLVTTDYLREGCSRASTLWVDNLSLSY